MTDYHLYSIEPFFLPFGPESIFCLFLAPKGQEARAGILYLPPFAEEMHKSRRMAALQARQFAQAGYAVLQIDLPGCGDSTGGFEDARWEDWLDCARIAYDWLRQKTQRPVALWGLRLGAALASELSTQTPKVAGLLLWQPVINGENFLTQFLRIKVASELFSGGKTDVKELRNQLAAEQAVEVGGYLLNPALAARIDQLRLPQINVPAPVYWLEIQQPPTDLPSPASLKTIESWTHSGITVVMETVAGESFWASQEIKECPALLAASAEAMEHIAP